MLMNMKFATFVKKL